MYTVRQIMARKKVRANRKFKKKGQEREQSPIPDEAGTSTTHQQARRHRVSQGMSVLREIRDAQDKTCQCIPRASFVRQVREISERHMKGSRWYYTALACIQEAAEDYTIEYFNDTCILAANARRVTVMNRDMNSLAMLRKRYENFIHNPTTVDQKMRDILLVSPLVEKPGIKIEEVTEKDVHERTTRLNEEKIEALKIQKDKQKQAEEKDVIVELVRRENSVLRSLQSNPSMLRICYGDGEVLELLIEDIQMLKNVETDLSDRVIFAALR